MREQRTKVSISFFPYVEKGASRRIRSWVYFTAKMLNEYTRFDLNFMEEVGLHAARKAVQDGEIRPDGYVLEGAKRYIRRQMIRLVAPCTRPDLQQRPDYGYKNGNTIRRGNRIVATKSGTRYNQRMRALGLCPHCGKKPETEFRLCNKHRKMAAAFKRKYRQERIGTVIRSSMRGKEITIIRKMVNND